MRTHNTPLRTQHTADAYVRRPLPQQKTTNKSLTPRTCLEIKAALHQALRGTKRRSAVVLKALSGSQHGLVANDAVARRGRRLPRLRELPMTPHQLGDGGPNICYPQTVHEKVLHRLRIALMRQELGGDVNGDAVGLGHCRRLRALKAGDKLQMAEQAVVAVGQFPALYRFFANHGPQGITIYYS